MQDPYVNFMVLLMGEDQYKEHLKKQIEELEEEHNKIKKELKGAEIPEPKFSKYFSCTMHPECSGHCRD